MIMLKKKILRVKHILSVHVQQFAQYDETGFYVACKGAKWQHGKKGKKIMFKCE